MIELPEALKPLCLHDNFVLYKLIWSAKKNKFDKLPINPYTLQAYPKHSNWQKDPANTATSEYAISALSLLGGEYGLGFLLTPEDPFFLVDIDSCYTPSTKEWSPIAMDLMSLLSGAAAEISQSRKGLHIIGVGSPPEHCNKNTKLDIELYTQWRVISLTGLNAIGSASHDCTGVLEEVVRKYFPPKITNTSAVFESGPVKGWNGPTDDDELIEKMLASRSGSGVFSGHSAIQSLWYADAIKLSELYPDEHGIRAYDESSADTALAQHLAFWTGNDAARIKRLMLRSGLVRDKWNRPDYLKRTIDFATSVQTSFYNTDQGTPISDSLNAPAIKAKSEKQRSFAEKIREGKLSLCTGEQRKTLSEITDADLWINNQSKTPSEIESLIHPIEHAPADAVKLSSQAEVVTGFQYLSIDLQMELFKGFVYVQDTHKIFTADGFLLDSDRFNATYGGYVFQLDESGASTTKKAWSAFTDSQVIRHLKAHGTCFRPDLPTGQLINEDNKVLVNTYVSIKTPRVVGDPTPFLKHLSNLLPVERDREILLSYLAACVQHKGVKFKWCPLIQGVEGNGKTLLTECLVFAIGKRYCHLPKAHDISNVFNAWLANKIFIGVEDVYTPDDKRNLLEILKPMITGTWQDIQGKGRDQVTTDICCNFLMNANDKTAVRKTANDRRLCVLYTAQQDIHDLTALGMHEGGDYFVRMYNWLKRENGFEIVSELLHTYPIPDILNPATKCTRAPRTSSTEEALALGLGSIEQEILEAVYEDRLGFTGGWISSVALDRLLGALKATKIIPINKRKGLLQSLGYDWHPALPDGRVNAPIPIDDNKKPRLFIKKGHLALNLTSPTEVARAYQEAQTVQSDATTAAGKVFGK